VVQDHDLYFKYVSYIKLEFSNILVLRKDYGVKGGTHKDWRGVNLTGSYWSCWYPL